MVSPSSPDAVLEIDSELKIGSDQTKSSYSTNITIDTECKTITTEDNSDCSIQNFVTNTDSTISSVQNDTINNTFHSLENVPEAQNCNVHIFMSDSACQLGTSSDHTPPDLSQEKWFKQKGLNIIHLNIHYLYSKFDELKILLRQQNNLDILCFCETFLNDTFSDAEIQLENNQLFRKDRQTNGGGLVIYVKENLRCSLREDLRADPIAALWVEMKHESQKAFLLGYTYRPPSSNLKWMTDFEAVLEHVYTENKEIIIFGDLHLNFLISWLIHQLELQKLLQLKLTMPTVISLTIL